MNFIALWVKYGNDAKANTNDDILFFMSCLFKFIFKDYVFYHSFFVWWIYIYIYIYDHIYSYKHMHTHRVHGSTILENL